ncbi:hypothetical protein C2E23DRAFT_732406 [Lenzites betulinus]|nr:hypothetical protein C2E23DRAFT_732406 [Lenzites betulinus]
MFSTKLTVVFAALAAAVSVSAAPATTFSTPKTEVVFRPQIISPAAGTVWPAGSVQTLTWDTSNIPEDAKNQTGLALLGYIVGNTTDEHLDVANPLATGFPITAGAANVTVPDVPARDDYVVVLFGDSGNTSPKFTITNAEATSSVLSSATVPAVPSASVVSALL